MPNYPDILFENKVPEARDKVRRGYAAELIYLSDLIYL